MSTKYHVRQKRHSLIWTTTATIILAFVLNQSICLASKYHEGYYYNIPVYRPTEHYRRTNVMRFVSATSPTGGRNGGQGK